MVMKILVVIDVQNDFVDGKLGTQEAINMIPKLKEKIIGEGKAFSGDLASLDSCKWYCEKRRILPPHP